MPFFYVLRWNADANQYEHIPGPEVAPNRLAWEAADGTDANGMAAISTNRPGRYVAFALDGAASASFVTNTGVDNAEVLYTADAPGIAGNAIRVRYVVSGNNTALSVAVTGTDITVNLATNGSGVATSTATQVISAVNAHATAGTLVTAAPGPGEDGTGVPVAMAYTNLAGGTTGEAIVTETSTQLVANSVPLTDASL